MVEPTLNNLFRYFEKYLWDNYFMKILHLCDLHIGKKVNGFSMISEQKFVLNQALDLIKNEKIEAVLIAGDVFDRQIPSLNALELFDEFLNNLNLLNVKTYIISGNHDNMDRLSYLSDLLKKSNIFVSKPFDGNIEKYSLNDEIDVYLMPYLYPALVKKYYDDENIKTYNDAIRAVIDDTKIDKNKFNILLAHQFVISSNSPILSQSEIKSVGGVDEVSYETFDKFDYTALGHLHCPQECGNKKTYYAGSIVKYSFSEINQKKSFCVLEVFSNKTIEKKYYPICQIHNMKEYKGYIDDFLSESFYKNIDTDDYIHFILLDETAFDAKKKLSLIYPNIMLLEFDNSFTRNLNSATDIDMKKDKTIIEHFCDFYEKQMGMKINDENIEIVKKMLNKEDEICDQ